MHRRLMIAAAALAAAAVVTAGPVHEHGVARVEIDVDPARLTVLVELPLHSLVGFERAPRDDAERRAADTALGRLRDGARLFDADEAAGCRFVRADLQAPALGTGSMTLEAAFVSAFAGAVSGHADLRARYHFDCRAGERLAHLRMRLFDTFVRLQRIDGQAATPAGPKHFTLRRPAGDVILAP